MFITAKNFQLGAAVLEINKPCLKKPVTPELIYISEIT
jgi:hypothetical protein